MQAVESERSKTPYVASALRAGRFRKRLERRKFGEVEVAVARSVAGIEHPATVRCKTRMDMRDLHVSRAVVLGEEPRPLKAVVSVAP